MPVLNVVQQVVFAQLIEQGNEIAAGKDRNFTALVKVEAPQIDHEAHLDRLVQEVRLSKSEAHVAHPGTKLRFD